MVRLPRPLKARGNPPGFPQGGLQRRHVLLSWIHVPRHAEHDRIAGRLDGTGSRDRRAWSSWNVFRSLERHRSFIVTEPDPWDSAGRAPAGVRGTACAPRRASAAPWPAPAPRAPALRLFHGLLLPLHRIVELAGLRVGRGQGVEEFGSFHSVSSQSFGRHLDRPLAVPDRIVPAGRQEPGQWRCARPTISARP